MTLAITPGDRHGVGPELVCRLLAERRLSARIYGDRAAMERSAVQVGLDLEPIEINTALTQRDEVSLREVLAHYRDEADRREVARADRKIIR